MAASTTYTVTWTEAPLNNVVYGNALNTLPNMWYFVPANATQAPQAPQAPHAPQARQPVQDEPPQPLPPHVARAVAREVRDEACPVSFTPLANGGVVVTSCGHVFSPDAGVHAGRECPMCRTASIALTPLAPGWSA
jgi:hypothetical protein